MTGAESGSDPSERVDKPWGHELIWAHTDRYVGKLIVIEAGRRLSLQKHLHKDESILVISGRMRLHLEADDGTIVAASWVRATIAGCPLDGSTGSRQSIGRSSWRSPRRNSRT